MFRPFAIVAAVLVALAPLTAAGAPAWEQRTFGTPTTAHGEGHLVFTLTPSPSSTPSRSPAGVPNDIEPAGPIPPVVGIAAIVLAVVASAVALALMRRHR